MQFVEGMVVAGRFRLGTLLGRGGMGSVWRAQHLGLDVPCAIKFIEGEMASAPEAQARFQREAKAAAQLRSPHVVQILDHGVSEGTPYIAMELLEGEELGKRLSRLGRLSPAETCAIIGQVCRALGKAHALGIIHRDLKPENIFLVRDDDREIAKVLDFGIAKSATPELGGSNTKTGAMLGTPYYMSPEQAQGVKQVDFRSDLWAMAVICFQAVTGRLPFDSDALGDLLVKIIVQPMPVPSQFGQVPVGFDAWWAKAAARDPAERHQSAKEFSDSLSLVCGVSQLSGIVQMPTAGRLGVAMTPVPAATASPLVRTVTPGGASAQSRAVVAGAVAAVALLTIVIGGVALWKTSATRAAGGASPSSAATALDAPKAGTPASAPPKTVEAPPLNLVPATDLAPSLSDSSIAGPSGGGASAPWNGASPPAILPSRPASVPSPATHKPAAGRPTPAAPPASPAHMSKPAFNAGF